MPPANVIADAGETHSGVVKALEKQSIEIEIKTLELCDFVINGGITFERVTLDDLFKSIFEDRKLFSRIKELANKCERPVLIIEGEDLFFSGRTVNPGSIQGFLVKIAVFFRVPAVFTLNETETAEVIASIARARQSDDI